MWRCSPEGVFQIVSIERNAWSVCDAIAVTTHLDLVAVIRRDIKIEPEQPSIVRRGNLDALWKSGLPHAAEAIFP